MNEVREWVCRQTGEEVKAEITASQWGVTVELTVDGDRQPLHDFMSLDRARLWVRKMEINRTYGEAK